MTKSRPGGMRSATMNPWPITGLRTSLRPATPGDVEILTEWFGDPEIFRYWGKRPMSRETILAKYTNQRKNVHAFLIECRGTPIGYIQYHQFEDSPDPHSAGLDMFVTAALRGRGLGADAVTAMVRFLSTTQGVTRITVDPLLDNPRAVTFWKKCGFRPVRDILEDDGSALLMELAP
jgi:aminoglycoside 6'-N-acetyltransferase